MILRWVISPKTLPIDTKVALEVISPKTLPIDTKVTLLLNEDGGWNDDFIQLHFLPFEAKVIISILRPRCLVCDYVCRYFEPKGVYLVKTVYRITIFIGLYHHQHR